MSVSTEVKDAVRAIAGDQADEILEHLEAGGQGAVMVSVLGKLTPQEQPSNVLANDWLSLSDLSASERTAALTHLILDITLGNNSRLNDVLISKALVRKVREDS